MKFAGKVFKIIKDNIPVRNFSLGKQYTPWMKADVLKAVKRKGHFGKNTFTIKTRKINKDMKKQKGYPVKKVREAKIYYEKEVAENVKENPKYFGDL